MAETLELTAAYSRPERHGVDRLTLVTSVGELDARRQQAAGDAAVLWVFGSGGGLGGPAGGVYTRLGERLAREGVTSLELDYRRPGDLVECVTDVIIGLALLEHLGKRRVALVGHSFGGAVVINAGVAGESVVAVAALSSQTLATETVRDLAPRATLFVHGEDDEVLPAEGSRDLFARAGGPKELILYPGCGHGLDECRDELDRDLLDWLREVFALQPANDPG
jgi:hypothetical protein